MAANTHDTETSPAEPGVAAPTTASGPTPGQAGSRHLTLALVVISMAQLMLVLDELIVNTALPHIQRALGFSGTGLEWVVTGYAVTFGGLLMLGGRAGDILGRRRMFSAGILFFTVASLFGGLSTQSWQLIAARLLQGAGAAVAAPAALSLIAVTFPEGKLRARALGVYAAMTGMGGAVGLIAGGLLTTYASWRWVFFVNVPVGLLLAFGARLVIPESRRYPGQWDLPGAIAGTAGFALLIYGLTKAATGPDGVSHVTDPATLVALAGSAAVLTAFAVIEARSREPLLPLWIFADRNRAGVYLILLCLASTFFGMFFFLTLFTQVVWGYSPVRGGLAYLPFVGGFILAAGICSRLVPRVGARVPMTIGAAIAPAGVFWLSRVQEHSHYLTGVCLPLLLFAAAAGLIFVPLTMTLVAGIADEHAGIASSMFNAGQQIGGAAGLAVIGSIAWTVVNNHVRDSLSRSSAGPSAAVRHAALVRPDMPVYTHALSAGVTAALTLGACATVLALTVTLLTIRVRREDRPASDATSLPAVPTKVS
jgi:EmrB/QacA subfamily drug resistance transporter